MNLHAPNIVAPANDHGSFPSVGEDEISVSDFAALVGIARASTVLRNVPATTSIFRLLGNLDRELPPVGTPLSRLVWTAAHSGIPLTTHNLRLRINEMAEIDDEIAVRPYRPLVLR